jgi:hypothetical protein
MQKGRTLFLLLTLFLLMLTCWAVANKQQGPVQTNIIPVDDRNLRSTASIPLNQVPGHPNITYTLKPLYDDRYFGSDIFNLTLVKTQGPALDIIIPLGQYLNTTNSKLQNMTIAKPTFVNLTVDADVQSILLTVYCLNVRGDEPQRVDNYTIVNTIAIGNLALILTYIHNHSLYDLHYTQLAVWAATDGPNQIPSGYIYNNTEVAWANTLLAAAGTSYVIPDVPVIPGFTIGLAFAGLGVFLFLSKYTLRRGKYGGKD